MARLIPSVARALQVLELFLGEQVSFSVPEMVARLGLPRSTTHELVHALVSMGYLTPLQNHPARFGLGLRVFELGSAYLANMDLAREGTRVARSLVAECDETTQLAVLEGCEVLYIAIVQSSHMVRLVSSVGRRLPAHLTAGGKALLSRLSDEEVVARYGGSKSLPGMTPNSITSMDRLLEELAAVRARGLAFDNCESNSDVRCVAAPVFNSEGNVVAAISISTPIMRVTAPKMLQAAELVGNGAAELSRRLGYRAGLEPSAGTPPDRSQPLRTPSPAAPLARGAARLPEASA